jgi:hypothetical protein
MTALFVNQIKGKKAGIYFVALYDRCPRETVSKSRIFRLIRPDCPVSSFAIHGKVRLFIRVAEMQFDWALSWLEI